MVNGKTEKGLDNVHGSISVNHSNPVKRLFAFLGPAYLVSVGYMDPGNWATDLEGGARFGYSLVWVLLMANLMAMLLQTLSARLGVVTGHDLAQASRREYSGFVNIVLWFLAEIAVAATDLAEVIGTIIALKLLFGLPYIWGCLVAALDTVLLLLIQRLGIRKLEAFILMLVGTIGVCFFVQLFLAKPDVPSIINGFWPTLPSMDSLFVAVGILGATVMPHNLYLHSALVQSRRIGDDRKSKARACKYNFIDSTIALNFAFFINLAILVLSATVFHSRGEVVDSLEKAYELLPSFLGKLSPVLFAVALLCAGQSSTLTGTLAGQIVLEGHLEIRIAPWLRRLVTRLAALVPAVLVIGFAGDSYSQYLLILSQVILSLQLAFVVVPLVYFTSDRKNMGEFASPKWVSAFAWLIVAIIVALNGSLVLSAIRGWIGSLATYSMTVLSVPLWVYGAVGLYGVVVALAVLLVWIIVKPFVRPAAPWTKAPTVTLDWIDLVKPKPIRVIGVALDHSETDAPTLNRALALAIPGRVELMLLHVVDTAMTGVYGAETGDRHAESDERYIDEIVRVLEGKGYRTRKMLLYGPDRVRCLVDQLQKTPVDLLVLGSHGHGLVRDLLFGETIDKVRHRLDVPMLIAQAE